LAVGNGYSSAQILAMQKDAIRRVNEMQRAAREKLRQTQQQMGDPPPESVLPEEQSAPEAKAEPPRQISPPEEAPARENASSRGQTPSRERTQGGEGGSPLQGILSRLNLDQETLLLLLLLVLLINEGADSKLILALVYVLL